jgi:hypothetical protein
LEQGTRWPSLWQAWLNPEKLVPKLDDHIVALRPYLHLLVYLTKVHGYTRTASAWSIAAGAAASGARGSPMRR